MILPDWLIYLEWEILKLWMERRWVRSVLVCKKRQQSGNRILPQRRVLSNYEPRESEGYAALPAQSPQKPATLELLSHWFSGTPKQELSHDSTNLRRWEMTRSRSKLGEADLEFRKLEQIHVVSSTREERTLLYYLFCMGGNEIAYWQCLNSS